MEPEPTSPEQTNKEKAEALHAQVSRLVAAEARLSGHSRAIPAGRDFHFYNNFDQFRSPAREIDRKSTDLLGRIESSAISLSSPDKQQLLPPLPDDLDDVLDRVVSLNDEALEMYGAAMDEFGSSRERQEKDAGGGRTGKMDLAGGFQMVIGKKKKKNCSDARDGGMEDGVVDSGAKVASRDTKTSAPPSRVPFHISSIPRPQDEFKILVNNSNQPFEHVWLERSEDGSRFIHPLEKLSASDFIDRHIGDHEPIKPPPLENTPFKLVEGVKELKELAAKLRDASEFAVDLEHNHYRSFQGLTCLMQISTRTEDFVVDTLKLRIQIGPHLREVFKDPSKRKVMHGANRDILWLQRDFGIYVCNLFDTGQASRVLQLERNSLEYLLRHYCGVTANKEYQNAEWRLRPLPVEMLKYAREDTHYLLYLYDVMSRELLSASTDSQDALLEVYNRSYDICMELYEKELLTDTSYLYIYGLHDLGFNSQQLAVVAGLCEWRDTVARAEDESTGYILPNKLLLQIARQLPLTAGKLRRLVNFKHPFVERYLGSVVSIIKSSMQNAPAFEGVVEELNKLKLESMSKLDNDTVCSDSVSHQVSEDSSIGGTSQLQRVALTGNVQKLEASPTVVGALVDHQEHEITEHIGNAISVNCSMGVGFSSTSSSGVGSFTGVSETSAPTVKSYMDNDSTLSKSSKVSGASIQVLKKPSGAFGALLGSSSSRNKRDLDSRKNSSEQAKAEVKLQEIKSSVSLPFYSFSGSQALKNEPEGSNNSLTCQHAEPEDPDTNAPCEIENLEEVIPLESESDDSQHSMEAVEAVEDLKDTVQMETVKAADCSKDTALCIGASENGTGIQFTSETNINDESSSLAELSSDFHQCFKSIKQAKSSMTDSCKPQQSTPFFQFKPFDYAAARKQMNFGGDQGEAGPQGNEGHKESKDFRDGRKGSQSGTVSREARGMEFQPPRRRQAFPPTGNRNATFRQ